MKKRIVEERVIKTEDQPLADADVSVLIAARDRQLKFLVLGYAPLAAILLFVLYDGLMVIYRKKPLPWTEVKQTAENDANFHLVVPYVCAFFFLMLTIYFTRLYLESLAPILKDLKERKKRLLYYIPEKTEMAFFNRYFLSSPIFKKQQVQISRDDFYSFPDGDKIVIETGVHSDIIFRFRHNEKEISVN